MFVIPALGVLKQEDHEFKDSLGIIIGFEASLNYETLSQTTPTFQKEEI